MNGNSEVWAFATGGPEVRSLAALEWRIVSDMAELKVEIPDRGIYTAESDDFFSCLVAIRNQIEPLGVRLCCNGTRRDAYPSRMNIQMGRGLQIQIRRMGSPATREDQVDIFGAADPDTIGTVAEQRQYFERWLDSLK